MQQKVECGKIFDHYKNKKDCVNHQATYHYSNGLYGRKNGYLRIVKKNGMNLLLNYITD